MLEHLFLRIYGILCIFIGAELTRIKGVVSESNKNFNEIAFTLRTILVKGVNAFRANYLFGQ